MNHREAEALLNHNGEDGFETISDDRAALMRRLLKVDEHMDSHDAYLFRHQIAYGTKREMAGVRKFLDEFYDEETE